ncbi:hypothetical protein D5S18_27390 [Nocardia panacis]|uniref:Uncharacterized protein n=1 Tax=Nocardia panacis TaxID=2340916 RepID=A0A3A4K8A2_9NOCA|nr:hypothetical protein D5S18_27390 [Nocardia panacis]
MTAAALMLAAPTASASITGFDVMPGPMPGFGTGCTYTVIAHAGPGEYLSFYDSQDGLFDPAGAVQVGASGEVRARWTPSTPGRHNLHAAQIGSEKTLRIEVAAGVGCPF